MKTRDWSELLPDIVRTIHDELPAGDRHQLGGVCSTWRKSLSSAAAGRWLPAPSERDEFPWIFFARSSLNAKTCRVLSLRDKKIYRFCLSNALWRNKVIGATKNWLLTVDDRTNCITAVNPFTSELLQFPPTENHLPHTYCKLRVEKISSPSSSSSSSPNDPNDHREYIAAAIFFSVETRLAFSRPGDISWTYININETLSYYDAFVDVIFLNQMFFFVSNQGKLLQLDLSNPASPRQNFYNVELDILWDSACNLFVELIESPSSSGELWLLLMKNGRIRNFKVPLYEIFRLDEIAEPRRWVKVESMEDHSILLGEEGCIIFRAPDGSSMKKNCIYHKEEDYGHRDEHVFRVYDYENGLTEFYTPDSFSDADEHLESEHLWIVSGINLVRKFE